ncbi:hypothetical protein Mapa_015447 [Marchantia paleacea]|nr:hypothetical protein Mapa_015447 [Marchantia paleacea]
MNKLGTDADKSGNLTNEFQEVKAGRRVVLEFPISSSIPRCKTITAVVLDSRIVAARSSIDCAALLVPPRKAEEWIYSSEGGQWQLLASAGVSRLIVLLPNHHLLTHRVESESKLDQSAAARSTEDDELKKILRPLVLALAPKALFNIGVPDIPFLAYSDNVVQRVEIDVAYSSTTGLMMVEDVEIEESTSFPKSVPQGHGSSHLDSTCTNPTRTWRRRLIFQRMPNLIQTEVSLITYPCRRTPKERKRDNGSRSRKKKSSKEAETEGKRVVDHSRLVHKYLPPIVAGFVLISPYLDEYVRSHIRAKVLCVGVGGGALPTFLHNQFGFHIQVVDLDEVVLDLARKHFGLNDGPNFEVTVGDGLVVVTKIAARAVHEGLEDNDLLARWRNFSNEHEPHVCVSTPESTSEIARMQDTMCTVKQNLSPLSPISQENWAEEAEAQGRSGFSRDGIISDIMRCRGSKPNVVSQPGKSQGGNSPSKTTVQPTSNFQNNVDPRVEIIVVDVDTGDARSDLSSPPLAFLDKSFLLSARIALHEGGMLVMNVVPCGKEAYERVIGAMSASNFEEVYEIILDENVHHCVLFAISKPACYPWLQGPTVERVERLVSGRIIQRLTRLKGKSVPSPVAFDAGTSQKA